MRFFTFGALRFIKAVKIFDGSRFLEGPAVLVVEDDGVFREITQLENVPADRIEFLDGMLCPGFINAHCHLELSHLKGAIKQKTGFCDFAIELMSKRGQAEPGVLLEAMKRAEAEMLSNGIVAVGDISNGDDTFDIKQEGKLFYHTFVELIALNPSRATSVYTAGIKLLESLTARDLPGSLAAHAPYSVSLELMELVTGFDKTKRLPFSIHNQESQEETNFFLGQASKVEDLYKQLNIDISWFSPPGTNSLLYYSKYISGVNALLVHNTCSTGKDVDAVASPNVYWCLCPGANLFIEDRLPDFSVFQQYVNQLCVGTDSLASNTALDVLNELNLISAAAPFFTEAQLLAMVTSNGASALGIQDSFGGFIPGKKSGLNLLRRNGTKFEYISKVF